MKLKERQSKGLRRSPGARLGVVICITLFLLIPMLFIMDVISEREHRRQEVVDEISDKWGLPQVIKGPVLSIPYSVNVVQRETAKDGSVVEKLQTLNHRATVLPMQLAITGSVEAETRRRSLFETVVYKTTLQVSGVFYPPDWDALTESRELADVAWDDAVFTLGLSDMRGIDNAVSVQWRGGGATLEADVEPGRAEQASVHSGLSARTPMRQGVAEYAFSLTVTLRGSGELFFTPAGRTTTVSLESNWPGPSFGGDFLPDERTVTEEGFTATWEVLHLNRNYPQQWSGDSMILDAAHFGVRLLQPVSQYQETMRTAKYAILFILLTYVSVFLTELLTGRVLHPIQYLLMGLGLAVFYLLVLSISEHTTFDAAYGVASVSVIALIGGYVRAILKSARPAGVIAGILALMYGFFYVLLQLEDYALLAGSLGLFAILAVVMYLTRKVDWYNAFAKGEDAPGNGVVDGTEEPPGV